MDKNIQIPNGTHSASAHHNEQIRTALREMLQGEGINYFVTANLNWEKKLIPGRNMFDRWHAHLTRGPEFAKARNALRQWHAEVDRSLLGSKWSKKDASERTFFAAFPEHADHNLHYHLLLRLPGEWLSEEFQLLAIDHWGRVVPGGSLDVQPLLTDEDVQNVVRYATKDFLRKDLMENFFLSTEFANGDD